MQILITSREKKKKEKKKRCVEGRKLAPLSGIRLSNLYLVIVNAIFEGTAHMQPTVLFESQFVQSLSETNLSHLDLEASKCENILYWDHIQLYLKVLFKSLNLK